MRQKQDPSLCGRERHIYHYSMVVLLVNLNYEDLKYPNTLFIKRIFSNASSPLSFFLEVEVRGNLKNSLIPNLEG